MGAETLSLVPDTAEALGTVGGRYANLRDASSVRVSPANMLDIKKAEILINGSVWHGDISFQSQSGANLELEKSWRYPVSIYGVVPLESQKVALWI